MQRERERGREFGYPETKTPVAKRKTKGSKAPNISPVLSGLTAKRLGSGGLKLRGGENDDVDEAGESDTGSCCCWVVVLTELEVEVEEVVSDMALMYTLFLLGSFVGNEIGL